MPRHPKLGYTEEVSRNTIRVFRGVERVNLLRWEYRRLLRCALCGAEEWLNEEEERERGWGWSRFAGFNWNFCPRHREDGRELHKTLRVTLRNDARAIYDAFAARVSARDGEPHRPWVIDETD